MFDSLSEKLSNAFRHMQGKGTISESNIEDTLKEVRLALLEADVNFKVVKQFVNNIKEEAVGRQVAKGVQPGEQFVKIVHDELTKLMGGEIQSLPLNKKELKIILVVGLNGAGKTTFSGKVAHYLKRKEKRNPLLVPADTFRPAAKDQLVTLAKRLDLSYFDSDLSCHPKDLATDAIKYAKERDFDTVIIDTAGRLHVDEELLGQLKEVKDSLPVDITETLLVADAMTGQEAIHVAQNFHDKVNVTGVVLTKMDSDARGGAALSIRQVVGIPIYFVGTGERMEDLELFHPDRMAKRILDMGDVLTLVEKAEEVVSEKEAEKMVKKMAKKQFTIEDFMKQMEMMGKLGPMENLLKMIPGMGGMLRQAGDLTPAKQEMSRMKVMISSMTKQERHDYKLLNDSRIKRIARGSGTQEGDVKGFISKFKQMETMMGQMAPLMSGGGMGLPGMGGGMPGGMGFPGMGGKRKKPVRKGKKRGPFGRFRR